MWGHPPVAIIYPETSLAHQCACISPLTHTCMHTPMAMVSPAALLWPPTHTHMHACSLYNVHLSSTHTCMHAAYTIDTYLPQALPQTYPPDSSPTRPTWATP